MKTESILLGLVYVIVLGACAWAAFRAGMWVIGLLAITGVLAAVFGVLKRAGAWNGPQPWNEGDGE